MAQDVVAMTLALRVGVAGAATARAVVAEVVAGTMLALREEGVAGAATARAAAAEGVVAMMVAQGVAGAASARAAAAEVRARF